MRLQEIKHAGAAILRAVAIRPALNLPSFFQNVLHGTRGQRQFRRGEGRVVEGSKRARDTFHRVRRLHVLCGRIVCRSESTTNLQARLVSSKSTVFNVDDNLLLRPARQLPRVISVTFYDLPTAVPILPRHLHSAMEAVSCRYHRHDFIVQFSIENREL